MATKALTATFNLHDAGKTAEERFGDEAEAAASKRGAAATGDVVFTDPNRNFTTDGITTSHKIRILEGTGNIQRDADVDVIGTTTIEVSGVNFDATEGGLLYAIYLPPDTAAIKDTPSSRGLGLVGFEEWLNAIETEETIALETELIALHHSPGLTEQVIVYDDTAP